MKKAFYQDNLYLDGWKKELDDESINKLVLNKLLSQKKSFDRILDVGTGSGVQIRRNIELGLLYSIYLNYDNNIRSHNTIPPQSVYETKHPQSVILSAKVNYKKVTLSFNYQYSYAETKFNYGNPNSIHPSKGTFVNSTQYANIRLSIPLY